MKKINLTAIVIAFFVFAGVVAGVYHAGRHRKPLVFVEIPLESMDWIQKIKDFNSTSISVVDYGPFNWDNTDDLGQGENSVWTNIDTDPNFIVYYKTDQTGLNVQNARRVLATANETIDEIQQLMGRYPYPSTCNGRKLSIYLPATPAEYAQTIDELAGESCNSAGSVGMHICHIGPLGALTDGIVLHPTCFDFERVRQNWFDVVLKHEMNHFVLYSSIDFGKVVNHPLWVVEGLAEYACWTRGQVQDKDSISFIQTKCDLYDEFPLEKNSAYWAGRSFYQFIEDTKGKTAVKSFITTLYANDLQQSLMVPFEADTLDLKNRWVDDMMKKIQPEGDLGTLLEEVVDKVVDAI